MTEFLYKLCVFPAFWMLLAAVAFVVRFVLRIELEDPATLASLIICAMFGAIAFWTFSSGGRG